MSEPLGCTGQLSTSYGPECTLETVSEEARRQTGKCFNAKKEITENLCGKTF